MFTSKGVSSEKKPDMHSHNLPVGFPNKDLRVFSTRRVFDKLGFLDTNIILIEMLKLFKENMYDMFVLSPTRLGKVEVRLSGYHFLTNQLDEKKIISTIDMEIPERIWFKIDDHHNNYVGTLLFPDEY